MNFNTSENVIPLKNYKCTMKIVQIKKENKKRKEKKKPNDEKLCEVGNIKFN